MLLLTNTPGCCSRAKPRAAAKGKKDAAAAAVAEAPVADPELQPSPEPAYILHLYYVGPKYVLGLLYRPSAYIHIAFEANSQVELTYDTLSILTDDRIHLTC